jgi:hypothetical protein
MAAEARERRMSGGHHYVPREIFDKLFKKMLLRPETWRVFDDAVTGPLPPGIHRNDSEHRAYTKAVMAMWNSYLERNGIGSGDVTPHRAREFIDKVLHSNDPRIRDYNARLRR